MEVILHFFASSLFNINHQRKKQSNNNTTKEARMMDPIKNPLINTFLILCLQRK